MLAESQYHDLLHHSDQPPSFTKLLDNFSRHYRFRGKDSVRRPAAFVAPTPIPPLNGQPAKKNSRPAPSCRVCETPHWYGQCPYLSPSVRQSGWTADPTRQTQAAEFMKDSATAARVQRSIEIQTRRDNKGKGNKGGNKGKNNG